LFLVSKILSAILAYVGLFLMINFLGSEVYGNISFALALSATFNVFADLGFGSAHIKRISEGKGIDACVSTYAAVKIVLTFVTVGVSIIAIAFWVFFLGGNLTGVTVNLVLLFILYQVFYNLSGIVTQTYYATMEQTKAQIVSLSDPLIRVPLIAIVVLGGMGAIEIAYAYVLTAFSVLVIGFLFLRRDKIMWGRPALFSSYLSFALPLVIIAIIGTVAGNMDKLLLGFFWDYNSVGYYSASLAFTGLFGTVGAAVTAMTFPSFSKLHEEGNTAVIRSATLQAERYISIIMMPIMTIIIVFPSEIARILLGPGLEVAGESMRFLAMAVLIYLINSVHSSQILAVDRSDLYAKLTLLDFGTFALFLVLLVPKEILGITLFGMGFSGAALAMLAKSIIMIVVIRVVVRNLTGTGSNPKVSLHIVAATIAGSLVFILSSFYAFTGLFDLIAYGLLVIAVFLGILALTREFRKKDVLYFLDIISARKMWDYMTNEVKRSK
jgi:O-antigen/teichoic acid export membrane protein